MQCNVCNSHELKMKYDMNEYIIFKCLNCSFYFARADNNPYSVSQIYDDSAYFESFVERDNSEEYDRFYNTILHKIEAMTKGRRLLDAGCGAGHFSGVAYTRGWDVTGTEVSEWAAQFAKNTHGIKVVRTDLNCFSFQEQRFDVINCFHVIEHLYRPKEFLQECHRILVNGGIIKLSFPRYPEFSIIVHEILFRFGIANYPCRLNPPEHVSYFNDKTILWLLKDVGFKVLSVEKSAHVSVYDSLSRIGANNAIRRLSVRVVNILKPLLSQIRTAHHLNIYAQK
jgi:SAM-dependent methyltransferase